MLQPEDPRTNRLLASLTSAAFERLLPHLKPVDLKLGQVLSEPGMPRLHAWFPTSAVVSKLHSLASGKSVEIAVVGNEGAVGTSPLFGDAFSINRNEVLITGRAYRLGALALEECFRTEASFRRAVLLHMQALMTQVAQAVICNRFHTVEQQVCGLLSNTGDRMEGSDLALTQELMASLLGVRRESVTEALGHLQAAGVVQLSRGHIKVIDADELERRSCECHRVVKREYTRLLTWGSGPFPQGARTHGAAEAQPHRPPA